MEQRLSRVHLLLPCRPCAQLAPHLQYHLQYHHPCSPYPLLPARVWDQTHPVRISSQRANAASHRPKGFTLRRQALEPFATCPSRTSRATTHCRPSIVEHAHDSCLMPLCNKIRCPQPTCLQERLQEDQPRLQKAGSADRLLPRVRAGRACSCPCSPALAATTAWQDAQIPLLQGPVAQKQDGTTPREDARRQHHHQQVLSQCHANIVRHCAQHPARHPALHGVCHLHPPSLLCVAIGAQNLSSRLGLRRAHDGLLRRHCKLLEREG